MRFCRCNPIDLSQQDVLDKSAILTGHSGKFLTIFGDFELQKLTFFFLPIVSRPRLFPCCLMEDTSNKKWVIISCPRDRIYDFVGMQFLMETISVVCAVSIFYNVWLAWLKS